jgi:hypothetical protein
MKNNFGVDRSLLSGSHRIIKHLQYPIYFNARLCISACEIQ